MENIFFIDSSRALALQTDSVKQASPKGAAISFEKK